MGISMKSVLKYADRICRCENCNADVRIPVHKKIICPHCGGRNLKAKRRPV